jgi:hypothetical protein
MSGGTECGRLGLPADGKYSGSINVSYAEGAADDRVSFVGDVALRDCDSP